MCPPLHFLGEALARAGEQREAFERRAAHGVDRPEPPASHGPRRAGAPGAALRGGAPVGPRSRARHRCGPARPVAVGGRLGRLDSVACRRARRDGDSPSTRHGRRCVAARRVRRLRYCGRTIGERAAARTGHRTCRAVSTQSSASCAPQKRRRSAASQLRASRCAPRWRSASSATRTWAPRCRTARRSRHSRASAATHAPASRRLRMSRSSSMPGAASRASSTVGPARDVETAIRRWRAEMRPEAVAIDASRHRAAGERLRELIWDPLRIDAARDRTVLVVPAGAIHLVNFSALPLPDGRFIAEADVLIHYLSSEREVIADAPRAESLGVLVVGGAASSCRRSARWNGASHGCVRSALAARRPAFAGIAARSTPGRSHPERRAGHAGPRHGAHAGGRDEELRSRSRRPARPSCTWRHTASSRATSA